MSNNTRVRKLALTEEFQIEADPRAPSELREALRELQRQHLELEMQNRALQEAQQDLEASRNRYMELYDFAPMACVSLDEHACIQDLNLRSRPEITFPVGMPLCLAPRDALVTLLPDGSSRARPCWARIVPAFRTCPSPPSWIRRT
jgi:hypothetical protein